MAETPANTETPSNPDTGGNMLTGDPANVTPESKDSKKGIFDSLRDAAKGTEFAGIIDFFAKLFEGKTEPTTQVAAEAQPESPTTPIVAGTEQRSPAVTQDQAPVVPPQQMGEVPNTSTPDNPLFGLPEVRTSSTNVEPARLVKGENDYEERNNTANFERTPVPENMRIIKEKLDLPALPTGNIRYPSAEGNGTPPRQSTPAPQPTQGKESNALW